MQFRGVDEHEKSKGVLHTQTPRELRAVQEEGTGERKGADEAGVDASRGQGKCVDYV